MIGTLASEEVEALLRRHRVGRLACAVADRPYVVPLAYAYDRGCVYGRGAPKRAIEAMRRQPHVCFEVDEVDGPGTWRSVIAEGVYEELTDPEAHRQIPRRLLPVAATPAANGYSVVEPPVVFRLHLTETSGRFALSPR